MANEKTFEEDVLQITNTYVQPTYVLEILCWRKFYSVYHLYFIYPLYTISCLFSKSTYQHIHKQNAMCWNKCHSEILMHLKTFFFYFVYVRNPITKCKYSSILLACPSGPTIQIVSMQKTKHLELSDSYWILGGLQILHEHKFFWTWSFYFPDILQTHYQNGSSTCLSQ